MFGRAAPVAAGTGLAKPGHGGIVAPDKREQGRTPMAHIDYYFSPLSPFAYLAGDGLEKLAKKRKATISWLPINLGRAMEAHGGLPVPKRSPARQEYRLQEMERIAKRSGLKINLQPEHWPVNPVPASAAILAAGEAGDGDVGLLSRLLLAACWAEEKDISDFAVVEEALREAGFDPAALDRTAAAKQIEPLTDQAIEKGVFGAPFYIVGEQKFWGQDRLAYLDDYLAEIG